MKKIFSHIVLLSYILIILTPFVFVLFSSFKENNIEIVTNPWGLPSTFNFDNYILAWKNAKIGTYFFNSFYISTVSSVVTLLFGAATSYALTRMKFMKASRFIYTFILLGLVIPTGSLLVPLYKLITDFNLYNTHWALILPYATFALPVSIYIICAFMRTIPSELEEAAMMDGLGAFGLFTRIILPISIPPLVTVFILNFLGNWNEFVMANFYLSSEHLRTLPVGMVGFRDAFNTNYAQLSAGIVFSVLPVLIIYSILQEKIIEGVTAGSVKG
ncbi:carbohydrate ABC transporter permease [Chengkuizengella sediminis]|uniref:carbohydrate ABC transporter permease n=1 Tax=Chengkuizengella sediminis TaxID=1885917 RepID=UPI00138A1E55|nr:carbohydrate ABC transporter permease [Chengkuizengella sediminis]NDI34184.1 carbohydrate ABC transporter permease [Chengkuizengella sediminis]